MSYKYDEYLRDHIASVGKAYQWILDHFPDVAEKVKNDRYYLDIGKHDMSKYSEDEYAAYDKYFYGGNRSHKVVSDFNYAWLHHIHNNPHHWQYWVLQNDDEPEEVLEMPYRYAIEMISDWWSFSFRSGNLSEIFDWYGNHRDMKLHPKTRKVVEDILDRIKKELASKTDSDMKYELKEESTNGE